MAIGIPHSQDGNLFVLFSPGCRQGKAKFRAQVCRLTLKSLNLKKRFYIVLVSRDDNGSLRKVPVPLHYAYSFVAVAIIGALPSRALPARTRAC